MKQNIKYIPHVCCPSCGDSSSIDHLMDEKYINYELIWWCDNDDCGKQYMWSRDDKNVITAEPTGTVIKPTSVLLRLPRTDLKIIVKGSKGHCDHPDDEDSHNIYFYGEHTCPSNYFRSTQSVWFDGDGDPHGLFEYVGVMDFDKDLTPEDFNKGQL